MTGDRAGRRRIGACQVDFAVHVSHAAAEVAVRRGHTAFPGSQDSHVPAQAGAAGRGRHGSAGAEERLDVAEAHGFLVNVLRGRNDDAAHTVMHLAALQDLRGLLQVFQTAVRARADDDLVDDDIPRLPDRMDVFWQVRVRRDRDEFVQFEVNHPLVPGVRIRFHRCPRTGHTAL